MCASLLNPLIVVLRAFIFSVTVATMACGLALKRPFQDGDDYLSEGGADVKRARTTLAHCSPFRPQFGTVAASLPSSVGSSALLQIRDPKVLLIFRDSLRRNFEAMFLQSTKRRCAQIVVTMVRR